MTMKFPSPRSIDKIHLKEPLPGQFPEFAPEDMNTNIYLLGPGLLSSLRAHLGNLASTIVTSEAPLGWNTSERREVLVPDALIAFEADPQALRRNMGYSINEQGKPPDFVLEIGSEYTGRRDITVKRDRYAEFGVPEYWRFDPSGGRFHRTHLAGDQLVSGEYQPITINRTDDEHYWGHSEALNLDLCWERGELRWYDPVGQTYLPSFDDERTIRVVAEAQRDAAEARVRELEERLQRAEEREPGSA